MVTFALFAAALVAAVDAASHEGPASLIGTTWVTSGCEPETGPETGSSGSGSSGDSDAEATFANVRGVQKKFTFGGTPEALTWTATLTFYTDTTCTDVDSSDPYNPFVVPESTWKTVGASAGRGPGVQDAEFKFPGFVCGFAGLEECQEYDLFARVGDLLFIGARPLAGGFLFAPGLRPISLSMPLIPEGSDPAPTTTVADIVGTWVSGCEINAGGYDFESGAPTSGYFKRYFRITETTWEGTFEGYATADCSGDPMWAQATTPAPVNAEGPSPIMSNVAKMRFSPEYDVAVRVGDYLALGARPLSGGYLTSEGLRPISLAPFLVRGAYPGEPTDDDDASSAQGAGLAAWAAAAAVGALAL